MRIGDLRHRITIEEKNYTSDGLGGQVEAWQEVLSCWANIKPVRMTEAYLAQQVGAEISHRVTIRYCSEIKAGMRVIYGDRIFNIVGVIDEEERKRFLTLTCKEMTL